MNDPRIAWRCFSTDRDEHPEDDNYIKRSSSIWSDYEWCGEWEPFAGVSSGQWYDLNQGGNQHSWVLWKRPCRPKART